uniref:Reverse transcriptase domain-containing protein n=1 Tax=Strongyloides venezuelensis TaxID=75913 RepID=A0A0K0FPW8_STRVS
MQEVLIEFLFSEEKNSGVILYVDDIFGYACSIKDLGELAVKVVNKLHSSGLKLNKEKSRLRPVIALSIFGLPFEVMGDNCKGAILFQMQEGDKEVIGYFLKRLKSEKKSLLF